MVADIGKGLNVPVFYAQRGLRIPTLEIVAYLKGQC